MIAADPCNAMASSQGDVRPSPMAYPAVRPLPKLPPATSTARHGPYLLVQVCVRPERRRAQSCAIALRSPAPERSSDLKRYSPDILLLRACSKEYPSTRAPEKMSFVGAILSAAPGYTLSPMRSAVSTRVASPAMMAESTPCAFIPVALCNCARCKHTCLCRAQWPAARCSSRTLRASGAASGRTTVAAMLPVKHPCLGGVNGLAHNAQQRQERPRAAARLGQPDLIGLCTATWTHACMRR